MEKKKKVIGKKGEFNRRVVVLPNGERYHVTKGYTGRSKKKK